MPIDGVQSPNSEAPVAGWHEAVAIVVCDSGSMQKSIQIKSDKRYLSLFSSHGPHGEWIVITVVFSRVLMCQRRLIYYCQRIRNVFASLIFAWWQKPTTATRKKSHFFITILRTCSQHTVETLCRSKERFVYYLLCWLRLLGICLFISHLKLVVWLDCNRTRSCAGLCWFLAVCIWIRN